MSYLIDRPRMVRDDEPLQRFHTPVVPPIPRQRASCRVQETTCGRLIDFSLTEAAYRRRAKPDYSTV